MTAPQSYPFLALAKRYQVPYGDVLTVADEWRHQMDHFPIGSRERVLPALHNALLWSQSLCEAIENANADFRALQLGLIDWQTGEPINRQRYGRALRDVPKPGVIVDHASDDDIRSRIADGSD